MNFFVQARREFTAFFYSPMAYIIATFYLLFTGFTFWILLKNEANANAMRSLLSFLGFIHVIFIPMVTMRLLAEERKSGTLEMLVTAPISDVEIALAKFFGALSFTVLMMAPTLLYTWAVHKVGGHPDHGLTGASYTGLLLISAAYVSIGLFISSLTANQIVAAILTFVVLFTFYFLLGFVAGSAAALPFNEKVDWPAVVNYVHFGSRLQAFGKGIVDTRDVVYFLSVVALGLFLTVKSLESRRWR
ncbi:MAG: ABC transporter permease [Candidatus Brocadiae bacterium]|nr:ABC transporter permease [Candidatus Brocadiia bacterium]